jgi:hypothetical protein
MAAVLQYEANKEFELQKVTGGCALSLLIASYSIYFDQVNLPPIVKYKTKVFDGREIAAV